MTGKKLHCCPKMLKKLQASVNKKQCSELNLPLGENERKVQNFCANT